MRELVEGPAIVRLDPARIDAAADALARAFHDDPLFVHVLSDAAQRPARLAGHFAAVLRYGLLFGDVLATSGDPRGVSISFPPGRWEVTPERAEAGGLDRLDALLGADAARRLEHILGLIEPFHHADVPADHWYTMVLGVVPEAQRQGLGRALLQPVMQQAEEAGQPCYLETSRSANVAFYTHLGYHVVRDLVDADSGLRLWTMRRDAPG